MVPKMSKDWKILEIPNTSNPDGWVLRVLTEVILGIQALGLLTIFCH